MGHSSLLLIRLMELFMPLEMMDSGNLLRKIDADTHQIVMSTTPIAGKTEQSLPLAESTRTPGHQIQDSRRSELLDSIRSRQRKRTNRKCSHA